MIVRYSLLDPTKNRTVLAETPVEIADQPAVAARLMQAEPAAEQVGFLFSEKDGCPVGFRMAGGEFCGNATMSAAAWYANSIGLPAMETALIPVLASGVWSAVPVSVTAQSDGSYYCRVSMPRACSITEETLSFDGKTFRLPVVRLPGAVHIVFEGSIPDADAERAIRLWCKDLGADCLGILFTDFEKQTMRPLVYVPAADTLFWENACASGTTAVGAYLARRKNADVSVTFSEPGGVLRIDARQNGELFLYGTVRIEKIGTIDLADLRNLQ